MAKRIVILLVLGALCAGWWLYGTWWPEWFQNLRAEKYVRTLQDVTETLLEPLGTPVGREILVDVEALRLRAADDLDRGRLTVSHSISIERVCQRLRRVYEERSMFEQGAHHIRTRNMESLQNPAETTGTRAFFVAQNARQWNERADYHRAYLRNELRILSAR